MDTTSPVAPVSRASRLTALRRGDLLPAAAHALVPATGVQAGRGMTVPAATTSCPQVESALGSAYRRLRAATSPVPAALAWRAADRRSFAPHGESSVSSPPV